MSLQVHHMLQFISCLKSSLKDSTTTLLLLLSSLPANPFQHLSLEASSSVFPQWGAHECGKLIGLSKVKSQLNNILLKNHSRIKNPDTIWFIKLRSRPGEQNLQPFGPSFITILKPSSRPSCFATSFAV